jgi:hypothetical protein
MVSVRINGEDAALKTDGLRNISEIIELIKSSIDPEHMITNILMDGNELDDNQWTASTSQYETAVIEVETGTPGEFVRSRLGVAWEVVRTVYNQFRDARKCFQSGNMTEGNRSLIQAVNTAKAFFEWYNSIVGLVPEDRKSEYNIDSQVTEITDVLKRLCQQQLYQSWWALGETVEKDLEPKLDKLEDHCRRYAVTA